MRKALVVGSGSIAQRHIRNLRTLYPDAEIICVSSSGRHIVAADVGASRVLQSVDAAIVNKPDIAIVASPATHHLEHAQTIIKAKIPVLIEKPLCVSFSDLSRFSVDEVNNKVVVGYNLRFMPAAKIVKNLISSDRLGRISTVFSEVGQYLPDWRPATDYRKGVSAQKNLGGGALLELSHELDYLNWFFSNFSEVSAVLGSSGILDIDVEDTVDALLVNQSGTICHLHLDFLQRTPTRFCRVVGEKGTLIWNLIKNEVVLLKLGSVDEVVFSDSGYDRNEMYIEQLRSFIAYVYGSATFESTLNNSIEVMRLVDAIRLSNAKRAWIKIEAIN
ncbi:MAG: Gfo/Idh/MocA family protein [Nitrincola lacisaponensis]|uniref:Gfo/Idh/MocA family protein n=1 Tax=Nitrincola lacisaponensis TaxID=267850 RepID=UPI00391AB9D1